MVPGTSPFFSFFRERGWKLPIVGVICEYNPLHLGHQRQLSHMRGLAGPEGAVVCLMSGSYVQRGEPALLSKERRACAAIDCGADLVLELPLTASLSSAEGFAAAGVGWLGRLGIDILCFGCETGDAQSLMDTASQLLSPDFDRALRKALARGVSFPAARQAALEALGGSGALLLRPNDILAVEYCKAILRSGGSMHAAPLFRPGDYHGTEADPQAPSATALRALALAGQDWLSYVPPAARSAFTGAAMHTLAAGERAVLGRLRTMADEEFAVLPFGSEGLWYKFMKNCRRCGSVEEILTATKSKRYTRTRLNRMLLCALLGISREALAARAPYLRVLALDRRGGALVRLARAGGVPLVNAGAAQDGPYAALERRGEEYYALFAQGQPEPPGRLDRSRVYAPKEAHHAEIP